MKRRFALLAIVTLVTGHLLTAADVAGKWSGQFDFQGTPVPMTFDIKTSGADVSGTVDGLPTANTPIKDGKVDGDKMSFWIVTDYQGTDVKLVCTGKISAASIEITMGTEDGSFSVTFPIKKAA